MPGTVCLQGGGEFSPGCRAMDADLVRRAGGRVVVAALAAPAGQAYDRTTADGVAHLRAVGAPDVVGAPDAREDLPAAVKALRTARMIVLPGGSPSRLLAALLGSELTEVLRDLLAADGVVMGASAGAMVLCPWTVLPDQPGAHGLAVEAALGVVPDLDLLVIPHWSGGSSRGDWIRAVDSAVPPGVTVLGIPEESGVLVEDGRLTGVGAAPTRLLTAGRDLDPGQTWTAELPRPGWAGSLG